jgi:4-oxalocrotonate tautomerase
MPHVIVKLYPGRAEDTKKTLAEEFTRTIVRVLNSKASTISVGIEDVAPEDWDDQVYQPDVVSKMDTIYKQTSN